jgi:hypothetical protein
MNLVETVAIVLASLAAIAGATTGIVAAILNSRNRRLQHQTEQLKAILEATVELWKTVGGGDPVLRQSGPGLRDCLEVIYTFRTRLLSSDRPAKAKVLRDLESRIDRLQEARLRDASMLKVIADHLGSSDETLAERLKQAQEASRELGGEAPDDSGRMYDA